MANRRSAVPDKLKEILRAEAGDKCANPGCSARRTHLHHILEWSVYQTHDLMDMIAVCPNCHDAIHHGTIALSDEVLREWKRISRTSSIVRDHVYIEPGIVCRVGITNTIAVESTKSVVVLGFSELQRLEFRVVDQELMFLELLIRDLAGNDVVTIKDNHVRYEPHPSTEYRSVPGRFELKTAHVMDFLPPWAVEQIRVVEPDYANGQTDVLSIAVEAPGSVRVRGIWANYTKAAVLTNLQVAFMAPHQPRPISLMGDPSGTHLYWDGPISGSLFSMG